MPHAARHDDATDLAAAIRRGETTASAALEASLARAAARADLGALRFVDADLGRAAASAFDELLARRSRRASDAPFAGVPFLMKDLGSTAKGLPMVAGSPALAARTSVPTSDDALARRFRRLGLVPFGTSTVPEFGLALTSEPPGRPVARNPFDPALSPGGSSGGAAAAVAAGIVAIAHATDAAGSIRVPSAACGLFGLKPTRGATPMGPGFGNHLMGIAGELVVARSARDVAIALEGCAGAAAGPEPDPDLDGLDRAGGPLRIAVVDTAAGLADLDGAARAAVDAAAAILADLGHRVERVDAGPLVNLSRRSSSVARSILSASLAAWLDFAGIGDDQTSAFAAAVRREGRTMPAADLLVASIAAARVAHGLWDLWERQDVILTPMLAVGAPPVGSANPDDTDVAARWQAMERTAPYAALANVAGVPAISVPLAVGGTLPGSVQLFGPMGSDRVLVDLAGRLSAARPVILPWGIAGLPDRGPGA